MYLYQLVILRVVECKKKGVLQCGGDEVEASRGVTKWPADRMPVAAISRIVVDLQPPHPD